MMKKTGGRYFFGNEAIPVPCFIDGLSGEIDYLKQNNLYRKIRTLNATGTNRAVIDGREALLFCSNDYLGLSKHPEVIKAFQQAASGYGIGSGASRLISGTSAHHAQLEEHIARFKRKERALVFSSGYSANLGIIQAFCGRQDVVIIDKLSHASIVDACKLSGGSVRVFPHKDLEYAEKILKQSSRFRRKLIVTDSVFSMDGDLAPLDGLVELKNRYGATLMIDEAHGTGVFGDHGRGAAETFGAKVEDDIDITMGTLSKAIGVLGGFVTGSSELIDYFINYSRSFIFSTAMPASLCAAADKSFELIETCPELRETLWQHVRELNNALRRMGIKVSETLSPIIPLPVGDEKKAVKISEDLLKRGIFIPAVRYPAVPKNKARLRLTVSAAHSKEDISKLILELKQALAIH